MPLSDGRTSPLSPHGEASAAVAERKPTRLDAALRKGREEAREEARVEAPPPKSKKARPEEEARRPEEEARRAEEEAWRPEKKAQAADIGNQSKKNGNRGRPNFRGSRGPLNTSRSRSRAAEWNRIRKAREQERLDRYKKNAAANSLNPQSPSRPAASDSQGTQRFTPKYRIKGGGARRKTQRKKLRRRRLTRRA